MLANDVLLRMPKTELHLHLEGTVSPETLWELATRAGVALPADSAQALRATYVFETFDTFIQLWLAMHASFVDASAYERMVDDFLAECRRQNIRYAEVHFTPYNHEFMGPFGAQAAFEVVTQRLMDSETAGGPVVRIICDIPSEALPEAGEFTANFLEHLTNPLVVAMGLGGPEVGFARTLAAPYFARARRAGYATVAHAGETAGAEHVEQALTTLLARRVQHGVHAVDDPATLALLRERDACCDIALTSNVLLPSFQDLANHPIREMVAARVPVTLSTDDPAFFNTDLVREYQLAHREVGLSLDQLWDINLNGLRYGLADVGLRRQLLREFVAAGQSLGLGGAHADSGGAGSAPARGDGLLGARS
ncbi:MAG: adenosine deaminase [Chloroflexota bacterium]